MKILNTMLGRQAIAAALVLSLAIPMSVGAFAEEPAAAAATDDTVVAGYLPPQATAHRRVTPFRATSC